MCLFTPRLHRLTSSRHFPGIRHTPPILSLYGQMFVLEYNIKTKGFSILEFRLLFVYTMRKPTCQDQFAFAFGTCFLLVLQYRINKTLKPKRCEGVSNCTSTVLLFVRKPPYIRGSPKRGFVTSARSATSRLLSQLISFGFWTLPDLPHLKADSNLTKATPDCKRKITASVSPINLKMRLFSNFNQTLIPLDV